VGVDLLLAPAAAAQSTLTQAEGACRPSISFHFHAKCSVGGGTCSAKDRAEKSGAIFKKEVLSTNGSFVVCVLACCLCVGVVFALSLPKAQ